MRKFLTCLTLIAPLAATGLATGCGTETACHKSGNVMLCGDFGTPIYTSQIGANDIEWPPVAIDNGRLIVAQGQKLLAISPAGAVSTLTDLQQPLTVPSQDDDGSVYVVGGGSNSATVRAYGAAGVQGQPRWQKQIEGSPAGTPPSIGEGVIYTATLDTGLFVLDAKDGSVVRHRDGASPAAVLNDGSIRYLAGPLVAGQVAGAPIYRSLVAEDAAGKALWSYEDSEGISDYAPGPSGETYIVTAQTHELRRVSADGKVAWSFHPPCADCTVAAAPTVTKDVAYFPVWEARKEQPIDPLYAIGLEKGDVRWTYDGFSSNNTSFAPYKLMSPGSTPVDSTSTQHHPAGRPVVATDGTLFVATDGAVAALDHKGQLLGLAMYDASVGEVSASDNFMMRSATWINPGVHPSPVLGPDGTLYVWDGSKISAFRTGKQAERAAWIAPFGGPSNAGRLPK